MTEVVLNKLSYDRLTAALELLRFKASGGTGIYRDDVNEILTVAGFDIIPKPETQKEVEVIEV